MYVRSLSKRERNSGSFYDERITYGLLLTS